MKRKWLTSIAASVALATVLAACGGAPKTPPAPAGGDQHVAGQPVSGGTLTWGTFGDIDHLNPLYINDASSADLASLIYSSLYGIDNKGNLVVDDWSLASELPKITNDGKTYTVKMKDTPKWTDGQPVTAEDVVFTFSTVKNPDAGSPLQPYFDKVTEIKALDAHTVQFNLKEVYAPFDLNTLNMAIVPAHVFKDVKPADLQKQPFGTDPSKTVSNGPFVWKEWQQKQFNRFEADPNYWGPRKPYLKQIVSKIYADQNTVVQALVKGEIDMVSTIPVALISAVQGKAGITLNEQLGPNYDYLGFNFSKENFGGKPSPFEGAKTRQAIAYALNRQGMVDSVLKGHGKLLNGPFLPGSWAYTEGAGFNFPHDAAKAKQLLAEDGWKPGADGILEKNSQRFQFELQTNAGNSRREQVAAIIQQNLKDVGIQVDIKTLDFSSWIKNNITPGKYQAMLGGWVLSIDPDAESLFSSAYFPPNGQNSGWYKNEKTDKLWIEGWKTNDKNQRKAIYAQISQEFSNDLPYVFLYNQNLIQAVSTKVHWADADKPVLTLPYGYMFHIQNWWVTEK